MYICAKCQYPSRIRPCAEDTARRPAEDWYAGLTRRVLADCPCPWTVLSCPLPPVAVERLRCAMAGGDHGAVADRLEWLAGRFGVKATVATFLTLKNNAIFA